MSDQIQVTCMDLFKKFPFRVKEEEKEGKSHNHTSSFETGRLESEAGNGNHA